MILESFLKPAFSLETSDNFVEIDTVYLLFCDLNLISFRRIRAFIRYVRKSWNRHRVLIVLWFKLEHLEIYSRLKLITYRFVT